MTAPWLDALGALCSRWGGTLELVDDATWSTLAAASRFEPYPGVVGRGAHGIRWADKRVIVVGWRAEVQPVIHEMGHVFACPDPPDFAYEYAFLGWEIAVARAVRVYRAWSRGMEENLYDTHAGLWLRLTAHERAELAAERLLLAQAAGLVDDGGRPLAIR